MSAPAALASRLALLLVLCLSLSATRAEAFGLRSHLWIGTQLIADLESRDCHVALAGQDRAVPRRICDAIRKHPGHFLAGTIGPDGFPDVLFGQTIIHPGAGQPFSAWLDALLADAISDEEIAFAYGFAVHAAGDGFAHSYVNNYAGGTFEITKRPSKDIETRHILLEKYIDQHLPDFDLDETKLDAPADFVTRMLLFRDAGPQDALEPNALVIFGRLRTIADQRTAQAEALLRQSDERKRSLLETTRQLWQRLGYQADPARGIDRRDPTLLALRKRDQAAIIAAHSLWASSVADWRDALAVASFVRGWRQEVEAAAKAYIGASIDTVRIMAAAGGPRAPGVEQERSALLPLLRWVRCYGNVLAGGSAASGAALCEKLKDFPSDVSLARAQAGAALPPKLRGIYTTWRNVDDSLSALYRRTLLGGLAGVDPTRLSQVVRELSDPARVDRATLNKAFARGGNGQLKFACASDWIDSDLGLRTTAPTADTACAADPATRDRLDPQAFVALRHALALARLSLLSGEGIGQLARDLGAPDEPLGVSERQNYSLLIDSFVSIDGNQQWAAQGMPPPRRKPYRGPAPAGAFGHPPASASPFGFPLYRTEALRRTAFTRLFDGPFEGAILARPEFRYPLYPYLPCAGDPFRARPVDESQAIIVGTCAPAP